MIAEIDRGLALIDERFTELAANGDERANRFLESLTRARTELDTLAAQASSQDEAIGSIAERTAALRESIDRLTDEIRESVGTAIGEAQGGADRLAEAATACGPKSAGFATPRSKRASACPRRARRSPSSRTASPPCSPASTTASAMRRPS